MFFTVIVGGETSTSRLNYMVGHLKQCLRGAIKNCGFDDIFLKGWWVPISKPYFFFKEDRLLSDDSILHDNSKLIKGVNCKKIL